MSFETNRPYEAEPKKPSNYEVILTLSGDITLDKKAESLIMGASSPEIEKNLEQWNSLPPEKKSVLKEQIINHICDYSNVDVDNLRENQELRYDGKEIEKIIQFYFKKSFHREIMEKHHVKKETESLKEEQLEEETESLEEDQKNLQTLEIEVKQEQPLEETEEQKEPQTQESIEKTKPDISSFLPEGNTLGDEAEKLIISLFPSDM